jgi:hypothetical protein
MDMDTDDFRAMLYIIMQIRSEFELKVSALTAYDNSVVKCCCRYIYLQLPFASGSWSSSSSRFKTCWRLLSYSKLEQYF